MYIFVQKCTFFVHSSSCPTFHLCTKMHWQIPQTLSPLVSSIMVFQSPRVPVKFVWALRLEEVTHPSNGIYEVLMKSLIMPTPCIQLLYWLSPLEPLHTLHPYLGRLVTLAENWLVLFPKCPLWWNVYILKSFAKWNDTLRSHCSRKRLAANNKMKIFAAHVPYSYNTMIFPFLFSRKSCQPHNGELPPAPI